MSNNELVNNHQETLPDDADQFMDFFIDVLARFVHESYKQGRIGPWIYQQMLCWIDETLAEPYKYIAFVLLEDIYASGGF